MLGKRLAPVLAAACAGAALFAPGTAVAASPTVAFQGGCGLLGVGASSHPDAGSVAVRSGGTVTFVNHLGQPAHLIINGADRGVVPRDNQVAVLFRQGRVSVTMLPGCLVGGGGDVGYVTVAVTADAGSPPRPRPRPAPRRCRVRWRPPAILRRQHPPVVPRRQPTRWPEPVRGYPGSTLFRSVPRSPAHPVVAARPGC